MNDLFDVSIRALPRSVIGSDAPAQPTGGISTPSRRIPRYRCTGMPCPTDPRFEYVLLVKKCSDPMLWYHGLEGKLVSLTRWTSVSQREGSTDTFANWCYSRDLSGYLNLVREEDVKLYYRLKRTP